MELDTLIGDGGESALASKHNWDIEQKAVGDTHLMNDEVKSFSWKDINVTVNEAKTKSQKVILESSDGFVESGELLALMGPSGSGKTTLLNVLARRTATTGAVVEGHTFLNGSGVSNEIFQQVSSYVEQEDALIGSLTIKETMHFAARLAHQNQLTKLERERRIDGLLASFGLQNQSNSIIGTPIRKGISGGQKRRLSLASQLITSPKILFLDEPTSGLDSTASWEVISYLREVAKRNKLIIIASIHQPSTTTFKLFDKLLLLSAGKSYYFGTVAKLDDYLTTVGLPIPYYMNPAEHVIELLNTDFSTNIEAAQRRLSNMRDAWLTSTEFKNTQSKILELSNHSTSINTTGVSEKNFLLTLLTLVHRSFLKSYRDVVAYGVRIAMYLGLAIMMGTIWLRLPSEQSSIQPMQNAIFFGSAFMSFMAVAYVPSFLEDRSTFVKERSNGLYGATAFVVANFIIGIPYLFLISVLFSTIAYWLSNFQPTATAFLTWIMWLFLDLLAAESLVVLVSALFPNFVIALALTAFANGLWMSVGGFLVPPKILNVFWRYIFHYIDYQTYVFQGMMVNEFQHRVYSCDSSCHCMYETELADQCKISGTGILSAYGYPTGRNGKWVGILLGIILGYRILGWSVLAMRK